MSLQCLVGYGYAHAYIYVSHYEKTIKGYI